MNPGRGGRPRGKTVRAQYPCQHNPGFNLIAALVQARILVLQIEHKLLALSQLVISEVKPKPYHGKEHQDGAGKIYGEFWTIR